MDNAFDFKKFEKRLLEALQRNEKFIQILAEEESAADQAKKMGLKSMGFGRWGKDDKVTHKTTDGKLEPVKPDEQEKEKEKETPSGEKKPQVGQPKQAAEKPAQPQAEPDPAKDKAQQAMPKAKLSGRPLSKVPSDQLQQVATRIDDLAKMGEEAKARGEKAPNYNLCQVSIPGTNLFCGDNKGIPRAEMPQFKGTPRPGSPADKLPKDKDGEVDTEEFFKQMLEKDGIKVSEPTTVPPDRLKATQSELVGVKVAGMSKVLADKNHPAYGKITAPIYVSRDGYVLDGHHRWAAVVAHNASHPDDQIEMQVRVIDEDIVPLVERSNRFAEEVGIRAKAADTGSAGDGKAAETPKEEPKGQEEAPKKGLTRRALDAVKGWGRKFKEEAKEFFAQEGHKGGSEQRRSLAQAMRDKTAGVVKATRHFFKHEAAVFRDAGRGVRSFFRGKTPNERERKAMVSAGIKILIVGLSTVATGGAAHGLAAFGKHLMTHFAEHVALESVAKGAGAAVIAAGPEDETDDAMMEKYAELLIKNFEEMDIPDEVIEKAILSFNANEKGEK